MRKIAIEEHFTTSALAHYSLPAALFDPPQWDAAMRHLLDFTDVRLPRWTSSASTWRYCP
jgi:2,3-dihydroxybenzoate decarboxylase